MYIYPTPSGELQIEWSINKHEPEVVIDLNSHLAIWFDLDLSNNDFTTKELNLTSLTDWNWIISAIDCLNSGE